MELIRTASRKRSLLSETIYVALNLALAAIVLLLTLSFNESPVLAYIFILLSKWRIFAVRPRFWFANVQTNLLDTLVGLSVVTLLWQATGALPLQITLTVLYALWLIVIKPLSGRAAMVFQAGLAQFVSITALFTISYAWPSFFVVLIMWLIGYAAARHVLSAYDEEDMNLLSLLWGLVLAQLGWLGYHWAIAYALPFTKMLFPGAVVQISQSAIIITLISWFAERSYFIYRTKGKIRTKDVLWMAVFAAVVLLILFLPIFNQVYDR
ncbi:hypothetical protein KC939_02790 [Candidatus Saccharibacteria bacterium]|nr:hypothetical protein [Candidatus Saccharibacteria bacterium]